MPLLRSVVLANDTKIDVEGNLIGDQPKQPLSNMPWTRAMMSKVS